MGEQIMNRNRGMMRVVRLMHTCGSTVGLIG